MLTPAQPTARPPARPPTFIMFNNQRFPLENLVKIMTGLQVMSLKVGRVVGRSGRGRVDVWRSPQKLQHFYLSQRNQSDLHLS